MALTQTAVTQRIKSLEEGGSLIALNRAQVLEEPLALAWYRRSRKVGYFDDLVRALK